MHIENSKILQRATLENWKSLDREKAPLRTRKTCEDTNNQKEEHMRVMQIDLTLAQLNEKEKHIVMKRAKKINKKWSKRQEVDQSR